jgi:PAS domain-containing protein
MEFIIYIILIAVISFLVYYIKELKLDIVESHNTLNQLHKIITQLSNGQKEYLENLPIPAWSKDINGNMLWLNSAYEKEFNVNRNDYIGSNDYQIWSKVIADRFKVNDQNIIKFGKSYMFLEKDNEDRTLLVWKFPIKDIKGQIVAIGGICIIKNKIVFI